MGLCSRPVWPVSAGHAVVVAVVKDVNNIPIGVNEAVHIQSGLRAVEELIDSENH